MFRKAVAVISLGTVVTVLGIMIVGTSKPATLPRGPRTATRLRIDAFEAGLKPATSTGAALAYGYRAGDRLSYRFDLRVATSAAVPEGFALATTEAPSLAITLSGTVELRVYETEPRFAIGWRFAGMTLAADAAADAEKMRQAAAELNGEVLVGMDRFGAVSEAWFPPTTTAMARRYLKSAILLGILRFPPAPADQWTLEEEDMTGRCTATYGRAAGGSTEGRTFDRITRTKRDYVSKAKVGIAGQSVGLFDIEAGRFASIRVDERVTASGGGAAPGVDVVTNGALILESSAAGEDVAGRAAALRASSKSFALAGENEALTHEDERKLRQELVAGRRVEDLIAALGRMKSITSEEAYETWRALTAAIALSDDAAVRAAELMLSAPLPGDIRHAIIDALGGAGTEVAQRELVRIIGAPIDPELRASAIIAVSMTAAPNEATERAIRDLASGQASDPLAQTALLGAGVMAQRLSSDTLADFVRDVGTRDTSAQGRQLYLEAIGNAGSALTLKEARRFLDDPDADVRGTALFALRFVKDDAAEAILLERAKSDASDSVRVQAVRALAMRNAEGIASALSDASPKVRIEAFNYFAARLSWDPAARAKIEAMSSDPDAEVRRRVAEALGP